jgi:hypothetical protein
MGIGIESDMHFKTQTQTLAACRESLGAHAN